MYDLSVIAPCYNEQDNVDVLVQRLNAVFESMNTRGEILLVNDCSTDNTKKIIDSLAADHNNVKAIHHTVNRGLMAGWDTGIENAEGKSVCFIDADLQNPPEELPKIYNELLAGDCDMVQGFRVSEGRLKDGRYILTKGLNVLLNAVFAMSATDNKSGFVVADRDIMAKILLRHFCYKHYHCFIRVSAEKKGYRVRECATLFVEREQGASFISRFPGILIIEIIWDVVKAFVEFRLLNLDSRVRDTEH